MIDVSPAVRPDLWLGAAAWTERSAFARPWRLLPDELAYAYSDDLADRATIPAGVRLEAHTDAAQLSVRLSTDDHGVVDFTSDDALLRRCSIEAGISDLLIDIPGGAHRVGIWLPTWGHVEIGKTELIGGDLAEPIGTDRITWAAYGSSITMCRTAPGPTESWPAIVARQQDWDLSCLGFGGQCHLDPVVVRTLAACEADVISLCLGINVHAHSSFGRRTWQGQVCDFIRRVREGHPSAALVVVSPIAAPDREHLPNACGMTVADIRDGVREVAEDLAHEDDRLLAVDGRDIVSVDEGRSLLADGVHPTPEGYRLMADRLRPVLSGALAIPS